MKCGEKIQQFSDVFVVVGKISQMFFIENNQNLNWKYSSVRIDFYLY